MIETGKLPPQAPDFERAVLGAVMLEERAMHEISHLLRPEDFYSHAHQCIWTAIMGLHDAQSPIDIMTVTDQLKKNGELETAGGGYYVAKLTNEVGTAANCEYHARIIAQKSIQRQIITHATSVIRDAYDESIDVFDLLDRYQTDLIDIDSGVASGSEYTLHDATVAGAQQVIDILDNGGMGPITWGIRDLDRRTLGHMGGELVIIGARPGTGKTALLLKGAKHNASQGKPVGIISLEMAKGQMGMRNISYEQRIDFFKLRNDPDERDRFDRDRLNKAIVSSLGDKNVRIYEGAVNINRVCSLARRWHRKYGIEALYVDYLQLIGGDEDSKGNREREVAIMSRRLKILAKSLNIPVILLCQLSREAVKRSNGKPQLSDLRESGAIEQDGDTIILLWAPSDYDVNEIEGHNGEMVPTTDLLAGIIAKNRQGLGSQNNVALMYYEKAFNQLLDWRDQQQVETNLGTRIFKKIHLPYRNTKDLTEDVDEIIPFN